MDGIEVKTVEEKPKWNKFKDGLMARHVQVKAAICEFLSGMEEPVMIAEGAEIIQRDYGLNVCKATFKKAVMRSIQNGNPYGLGIKCRGQYNIVYKKVEKHERNDGKSEG